MIRPHAFHPSTRMPDGRVLVAGGLVNDRLDGQASTAAELYDPNSGTWTATQRLTDSRWGHTATLLPNGKVLVAGGYVNGSDSLCIRKTPGSLGWYARNLSDCRHRVEHRDCDIECLEPSP